MITKKNCIIYFSILCAGALSYAKDHIDSWIFVDFEKSLQQEHHREAMALTKRIVGIDAQDLYASFKDLYDHFNLSVIKPSATLKIPKIVHQIWLNDEQNGQIPPEFLPYVKSCMEKHLGNEWRYKLWTDQDVKNLDLYNREFYDASANYGVKSDLLKWEIIYKYGGVYLDTDIECLRTLEILHYTYDFYVGIQPLETKYLQLGAAVFAGIPHHPILKHCIETIKDDWERKGTVNKTGPIHFTKSFYQTAGRDGRIDIALPPHYFYPICSTPHFFQTALASKEEYARWINEGAFTVHHWSMSWMPAQHRPLAFKKLPTPPSCVQWNE